MTAYVFPGQGAQHRGMGAALFGATRRAAQIEAQSDAILGYSIRELCLENGGNRLSRTEYTQPALYVVNALAYEAVADGGSRPHAVAGHSLGEYNALLAAGAFDFVTGLRLVQKRGALMSRVEGGGMAAVIGLTPDAIRRVLHDDGLAGIDIANFNAPLQTVISGPRTDITRAAPVFERAGAQLFLPLQVSGAFHSRCMAGPAERFGEFLAAYSFDELQIPVVANVTGGFYPMGHATRDIRDLLVRQLTSPVRWTHGIEYLLEHVPPPITEIGPGNVLTRLLNQIKPPPSGERAA